jgi:SAM-dependent MidA family methyltransferase
MWKQGEMLTIDYGNTSDQMYLRRPNGSLRAYLLQQRIEGTGIYQNPGLQDITADVNFTDLVEWSEPWLHPHQLANLTEFLQPFLATEDQDFIRASGHFMFLLQSPHDRYK